jgi:DNA-binding protein H-NS
LRDLQTAKLKGKAKPVKGSKPAKAKIAVAAKYRGPNGETWSGRGLKPKWMAALITEGKTKEDFLI